MIVCRSAASQRDDKYYAKENPGKGVILEILALPGFYFLFFIVGLTSFQAFHLQASLELAQG